MHWKYHYKKNTVSAEEAVELVKSGDTVAVGESYPEPTVLMGALAARRNELSNVRIMGINPGHDPGWYEPDWSNSFNVVVQNYLGQVARPAYRNNLIDYYAAIYSQQFKHYEEHRDPKQHLDVNLALISTPDEHGFCSFGAGVWDKRKMAEVATTVLAQVDPSLIRTYGTNYIHVSDIAKFVEHTRPKMTLEEGEALISQVAYPSVRTKLQRISSLLPDTQRHQYLPALCEANPDQLQQFSRIPGMAEPPPQAQQIVDYVSELIRDGDTLQIGAGTPSGFVARLGALDDKKDLGWHSEMGARGVVKLIEKGVINGSRKSLNVGVAVFTSLSGCSPEEVEYAADNPLIELRDVDYVANIQTVSAHDNYVSINNGLAIDFSGQITCETVEGQMFNGTGGQPELHMGAVASKGGRAITLMWSVAKGGKVSRIVPRLPEGSMVTIPRAFADTVITEYGVAQLLGKSTRERAQELIAIAHPDFRNDLQQAADQLYYC